MKVLEHAPTHEGWTHEMRCPLCACRFEVDEQDYRAVAKSPASGTYMNFPVQCPDCRVQLIVPQASIPEMVRQRVNAGNSLLGIECFWCEVIYAC